MATRSNGRTSIMVAPTDTTPAALAALPRHTNDIPLPDAPVDTPEPPAPPVERLAEGDRAYNRRVCRERAEAEQRLAIAAAAMQSWWQFVKEKYGLAEADVVDAEGNITRA
jgi:hypothetical protein